MNQQTNQQKYYKKHYKICFYTNDKYEFFVCAFNNVRDILKFLGIEYNRENFVQVSMVLYKSLRSKSHITRILGKPYKIYIINNNYNEGEKEK